jgi:ribosomal protein L3
MLVAMGETRRTKTNKEIKVQVSDTTMMIKVDVAGNIKILNIK